MAYSGGAGQDGIARQPAASLFPLPQLLRRASIDSRTSHPPSQVCTLATDGPDVSSRYMDGAVQRPQGVHNGTNLDPGFSFAFLGRGL